METKEKKNIPNKSIRRNYFIVSLFFGLFAIAILVKANYTSFVEGPTWRERGKTLVRDSIIVSPVRGNIYSCNDELMATSEYLYRIYIDLWADGLVKDTLLPKYIDSLSIALSKRFPEKNREQYRAHLQKGFNIQQRENEKIKNKQAVTKTREYLLLDRKLNYVELCDIKKMPLFSKGSNKSGLIARKYVKRTKPYGSLASRTIGDIYGDFQKGGKNGLELEYDSLLRGYPGTSTRKKVSGRFINVINQEPINGMDIVSTIDIAIQDITEKALVDKLKEIDAESGTAVVMEVATGQVKAITNMGRVSEGVWTETKNHAVADETEPGSTFKVASMMVALEDGVIHPSDTIDTGDGVYIYAGARMTDHNWNKGGYGRISAAQAIWYSSNIGVAKIILRGYEHDPKKYVEGLRKIGLMEPLDLEIPGAGKVKIKSPDNKTKKDYWSKTTLPWMSFGYETRIPPIYTLTFFNAIANDGKMVRPYFVKEIRNNGDVEVENEPVVVKKQICSENTLKQIQQMLLDVIESEKGTGKSVYSSHVRIAGKTGTAQISQGTAGYSGEGKSHQVAFCGYFPADKPQYSCIVVIRKPRIGYPSGGTMSGGVFKRIAEEINARNNRLKPGDAPKDSIPFIPGVKAGVFSSMKYVMNKLDVPYKDEVNGEWASAGRQSDKVDVKDRKVIDNLVPDVVGMGAKDAVYLLEKQGLRVSLSGKGSVRSQSLTSGSRVVKGQTVALVLR